MSDIKKIDKNKKESSNIILSTIDNITNIDKISQIGTPLKNLLFERFCVLYSITLDATNSYLKARKDIIKISNEKGIKDEDVIEEYQLTTLTYDTARKNAYNLLNTIDIQERLQEVTDFTAKNIIINKSKIIEDIQNELNLDMIDVFSWTDKGNLIIKDIRDIPPQVRKTIKSIKQDKNGKIEIAFYDKQKAREMLMRHAGMLSDTRDININLDLGSRLAEAHARVLSKRDKSKLGEVLDVEFEEIGEND